MHGRDEAATIDVHLLKEQSFQMSSSETTSPQQQEEEQQQD